MKRKTVTAYQAYTPHYMYSLFYRGQHIGDYFQSGLEQLARDKGYTHIKYCPAFVGKVKTIKL